MNTASGEWQAGQCRGGAAGDQHQAVHAQPVGVAAQARGALGVGLDRHRLATRVGQQPLDRDRSGAGTDVPQPFAGARGEGAERQARAPAAW